MANNNAHDSEIVEALRARLEQVQREAQTYRGEVYRHLGVRRVGELAPPPLSLPENMNESERLQALIAHAERERDRYRNEVQRIPVKKETLKKRDRAPGRGGCLTAWLVLMYMAIGMQVVGTLYSSLVLNQSSSSPVSPLVALLLVPMVALLQAIAVFGIWNLEKWGYYMVVGFFLLRCLIYLALITVSHELIGFFVLDVIGALLGLGILSLLVFLRWYNFE